MQYHSLSQFIAQVIIEMHALIGRLEDCIISGYNYPMQGDYNTEASTEALIFKMATV